MDFIALFKEGGIPLVIVATFIVFLWKVFQYFIDTLKEMVVERQGIINKFDDALQIHCNLVVTHLTQMETKFNALVVEIEEKFKIR